MSLKNLHFYNQYKIVDFFYLIMAHYLKTFFPFIRCFVPTTHGLKYQKTLKSSLFLEFPNVTVALCRFLFCENLIFINCSCIRQLGNPGMMCGFKTRWVANSDQNMICRLAQPRKNSLLYSGVADSNLYNR